jgi:hypothetical protein
MGKSTFHSATGPFLPGISLQNNVFGDRFFVDPVAADAKMRAQI